MKGFSTILIQLLFTVCLAQTQADSIAIVTADWHEQQLAAGLTVKQASFAQLYRGPQRIFILEVDPTRHPLSIVPHERRELTTEKAHENHAMGAINGTYFDMGETGRSVCYIAVSGTVIDYTKSGIDLPADGAVVLKKKKVSIIPWSESAEHSYKVKGKSVMCCGPLMVNKGKEIDFGPNPGSHIPSPNPRSGIAKAGKHRVMLIVVDGRRPEVATGVTIPEFAHLCRILGARSALNLDGGGSSVLWTENTGILNNPSDGTERAVSNSIIVK